MQPRAKRKIKTGVVVSDKMNKTVVVDIERVFRHPFYHKVVRASKRFKAHDEENKCVVGDKVEIMETKPLSKDKCWRVVKILGKGKTVAYERPKKKEKELEENDTTAEQTARS